MDGIKEMIDLANEQITKAEVGKAKAEKDVEKYGHTIQVAETQLGEMKAEVDELDNVLATCQEDMAGVREKVEMAQEVAEKHSEELEEMKSELDEKQALINKFRQKEVCDPNRRARYLVSNVPITDGHKAEVGRQRQSDP